MKNMRKYLFYSIIVSCFMMVTAIQAGSAMEKQNTSLMLKGFPVSYLSPKAQELLKRNGFVVTPGFRDEMFEIYNECKERNQPVFVTTDALLHTSHIFFDYLLRILEIEKLNATLIRLTDKMLDLSIKQYTEAKDPTVKESARLNIGFFAVPKKIFNPEYRVGYGLDKLVDKELNNINAHEGVKVRALLAYIKNPDFFQTTYAYEDYTQYVPRGHYTRNQTFEKYFRAMMWYGRIDFKLRPATKEPAITYGKKMTLQAILMADALRKDKDAYSLWKKLYEPTVFFVGKTDDLSADDYIKLINETFPSEGSVDRFGEEAKLSAFIEKAMQLRPPKILSGMAFAEDGEFAPATRGFRFMGQRFIPDSYIFQQLVYGVKDGKTILHYTGKGKPFTMEVIPNAGAVRAFPRGLDILAVLGSRRALAILEQEGDTEYSDYYDQLNRLKEEFASLSTTDWQQNLYWRWLYSLLPLLEEKKGTNLQRFLQSTAWLDKEIQTALGSWAELRHDTILYAKQSSTLLGMGLMPQPKLTYGYVEPYPEVYARLKEMMTSLRKNLATLEIDLPAVSEKLIQFENLLENLKTISIKELNGTPLLESEYRLIWNIGDTLCSLKHFPPDIMEKITSGTDEKMALIADVHTEGNTGQVLEVGVGAPFNIFVIINDDSGYRLCRGAVFSYYEFKHPMDDRLTDEKWQELQRRRERPEQPRWVNTFTAK
ncbi:DUF3160 domain-containing protein [Candidatus Sumerlaeota bacterium]|nr:DUF3160 domain-containing protein [Candidatus Sumerlaeota bacterium]